MPHKKEIVVKEWMDFAKEDLDTASELTQYITAARYPDDYVMKIPGKRTKFLLK